MLRGVGEQAAMQATGVRPNSVGAFGGHHHRDGHPYLSDPSSIIVTVAKARVRRNCWGLGPPRFPLSRE